MSPSPKTIKINSESSFVWRSKSSSVAPTLQWPQHYSVPSAHAHRRTLAALPWGQSCLETALTLPQSLPLPQKPSRISAGGLKRAGTDGEATIQRTPKAAGELKEECGNCRGGPQGCKGAGQLGGWGNKGEGGGLSLTVAQFLELGDGGKGRGSGLLGAASLFRQQPPGGLGLYEPFI